MDASLTESLDAKLAGVVRLHVPSRREQGRWAMTLVPLVWFGTEIWTSQSHMRTMVQEYPHQHWPLSKITQSCRYIYHTWVAYGIGYTADMFDKYRGNSTNDSSVNYRIWNLKLGYSQFSSSFWLETIQQGTAMTMDTSISEYPMRLDFIFGCSLIFHPAIGYPHLWKQWKPRYLWHILTFYTMVFTHEIGIDWTQ